LTRWRLILFFLLLNLGSSVTFVALESKIQQESEGTFRQPFLTKAVVDGFKQPLTSINQDCQSADDACWMVV
jgi:hypothetical protein